MRNCNTSGNAPVDDKVATPWSGDLDERDQVLMTRVGLRIPANLSFEDWEQAGRHLSGLVDSSSWCLGDWLVYGKAHYAERYVWAIRAAGLQYQTLRNYAWVSRRFELRRRRAALSFQHHAEVASLPTEEQDAWLDRAEEGVWTTKRLRVQIRDDRSDDNEKSEQDDARRRIEVPGRHLAWWRKAAIQSGVDFDSWILDTLDRAAKDALIDQLGGHGTFELNAGA